MALNEVKFAISNGAENVNAGVNLAKKLSQLEKAQAEAVKIRLLADGRIRYYDPIRKAKKSGETVGASYVTEYSPKTGRVRSWNECYDQACNVNRVHPKTINGQIVKTLHYPPILAELLP